MANMHKNKILHRGTSEAVVELVHSVPFIVRNKLKSRINEVGLTQKQLSALSGLREGTISDFVSGKK